ncbi:ubiquitin carboxyl-terminal hydrolase MINDY-1-like [Xenia sp. Carnegie-2017]|uniref:ubiquitin carboxyl-terminal hydrolase MINDY-1-like n=1 Tax=Xenia sp. Carnegie-2017 TaxID=2897299 RepID=UPI001F04F877|nr:ubiquitin carboxyl-terminal hydrolase MINDY-1-like [Xenia sp. Carnegie-2017]
MESNAKSEECQETNNSAQDKKVHNEADDFSLNKDLNCPYSNTVKESITVETSKSPDSEKNASLLVKSRETILSNSNADCGEKLDPTGPVGEAYKNENENEMTSVANSNIDKIVQEKDSELDSIKTTDFSSKKNDENELGNTTSNSIRTNIESSNSCLNQQDNNENSNASPYFIKWILWKGIRTAIVTQNDNGPCPLLAIINILLLRRVLCFPSKQEMVTTQELMDYLGDVFLEEIPKNMNEAAQRNFEQNMQDALSILPKLTTGLDVNVKFTGVNEFEFTPECVIFDLLNIHLYHGWLLDPQNIEFRKAIGNLSYNQLVEKIVASKETDDNSQLSLEGYLAESFLDQTANQLTCHGVCELNAKMKDDELCVFFRNNHFNTLYKYKGELFVLLTDHGFLTEEKIVWQILCNVDGDGIFVDDNFKKTNLRSDENASVTRETLSQEDEDLMLALSLSKEQQIMQTQSNVQLEPGENRQPSEEINVDFYSSNVALREQEVYDRQYAIELQEEENRQTTLRQREQQQHLPARRADRRQTSSPLTPHVNDVNVGRQNRSNCVII